MDQNSKEFKKLKNQWYKKIKAQGFEDIEDNKNNLKRFDSSRVYQMADPSTFPAKQYYYRLAGWFLNEEVFKNYIEKEIWRLHTEGKTQKEIIRVLKSAAATSWKVKDIIKKLSKKMIEVYDDRDDE